MKKAISLHSLPIGEPIAQDIYDQQSRLLLKQGTILSESFTERLKKNDINTVFITMKEETKPSPKEIKENPKPLKNVFKLHREIYRKLEFEQERIKLRGYYIKPIQKEFSLITKEFTDLILKDIGVSLDFYFQVKNSQPDYNYAHHHINTAILAVLISSWLNLNKNTINEIANVAMLHDIGETRIPIKILSKPSSLTGKEMEIVKTHPLLGLQILHKTDWINNRELYGVLTHHERLNGQGYPNGILGSKIPIHSRVVSVSSIFNSATTNRVYAKGKSYLKLLLELRDRSYGELDSKITQIIYKKLSDYFQDKQKIVLLNNGDKGHLIRDKHTSSLLVIGEEKTYNLDDASCPQILKIS